MKKTLLATALAVGFAGAATAQTSVTLYGVVDGGLRHEQRKTTALGGGTTKETRTGLVAGHQNGNRWGLRGSEDLGGGLRVLFVLESGFDLRTGESGQGNRLFGRRSFMALQNDAWGTLQIGRDYSYGGKYMPTVISPHGDIYGLNGVNTSLGSSTGAVRVDNMIAYETPVFSGFQLGVGYSFQFDRGQAFDPSPGLDPNQRYLSTAVRYTDGPLKLAAHYDYLSKRDTFSNDKNVKSWGLGGSYDFGTASLHLGYAQDKDGVMAPRTGALAGTGINNQQHINGFKSNNYNIGVGVPVGGAGKFMVNWQSARLGNGPVKTLNRTFGGKNSQNVYSVMYRYDLSQRTNVYATAGYANGYSFNNTKATEVTVGLKHSF